MPRIPYADPATLELKIREMVAGTPINIVRMAAHASPMMFVAQANLSYAIGSEEVIEPQLREVVIIRVAALMDSAYEIHQHRALAQGVGFSLEQVEAILAGDYAQLSPLHAAAARFTDDLVLNISPSDETQNALRALISDRELVNLTLVAGHYMSLARLIAVTGPDMDSNVLDHLPDSVEDHAGDAE